MGLTNQQTAALLRPIRPERVLHANGQSHVPAYDVAAHLTRVLGFGNWDTQILSCNLLFETSETRTKTTDGAKKEYDVWTVGYSATVRLTIKDREGTFVACWENGACGDAINQPSRADAHHLAMTTAISTALKRCAAFGLGDQFGLSLYNRGSVKALIGQTLVGMSTTGEPTTDLESHISTPETLGNDEKGDAQQELESARVALVGSLRKALSAKFPSDADAAREFVADKSGVTGVKLADLAIGELEAVEAALR